MKYTNEARLLSGVIIVIKDSVEKGYQITTTKVHTEESTQNL